jgi:hypothetical protein
MLERTLGRGRKCDDPVIKHSLLVDKLLLTLDLLISYVETEASELDEECQKRVKRCADVIQNDLLELMSWIRNPVYSPDHPVGSSIMMEAKSDFAQRTTSSRKEIPYKD